MPIEMEKRVQKVALIVDTIWDDKNFEDGAGGELRSRDILLAACVLHLAEQLERLEEAFWHMRGER